MRSKKKKPLIYHVFISLLVIALCFFLGIFLDSKLMVGEDGVQGHGMPFFTIVTPAIAIIVSVLRVVVALVKEIIADNRERKRNL